MRINSILIAIALCVVSIFTTNTAHAISIEPSAPSKIYEQSLHKQNQDAPISTEKMSASYLQGRISVNGQITNNRTPVITGTLPTWCSDIVVLIGTDQMPSSDYTAFYSDYGEVAVSNGNWTLDLNANAYGLVNSVYTIVAASECDYSGTYADPLYADIFYGALSVVPDSCDQLCVPIYRFYNTSNGAHFYTSDENEKRQVLGYPQFRFEGIVGYAKQFRSAIPGMTSVHRFYNKITGTHFYTSSQSEATNVNNNQTATYRYEGVAYYAYDTPTYGTISMHRFYKFNQGVHFYTASQAEASAVNATQFSTYRYEGVSYNIILN